MLDSIITPFMVSTNSILLYGTYNYWMVSLSICIAIFASFMGLQVALQAADSSSPKRKQMMLLIGSIALGGGIWSMHFIGMLAFNLCTRIDYGWILTLLSLLPGIAASWVALHYINSHQKGRRPLFVGGLLVGSGIGTMHYTGMAAMEMAPLLRYDLKMFFLSIIVAVSLAIIALSIRCRLMKLWKFKDAKWQANMIASLVMGCAISGMHYTGMAAARFVKPPGFEINDQLPETSLYLALAVSSATIFIILLVLGINLLYRYKDISMRALESERRLKATLDTAVDGIITIDSCGTVVSANHATERLLGWSESELLGKNVNILVPDPHYSNHDGYLQRYLETREARIIGSGREVQALHKNGKNIDIRLEIGHVTIARNDYFVAFISDIRQRLKMESALRENEERLRSLISNIPGIAFRCMNDKYWSMIFISDAVEAITGYPATDFKLPSPKRNFSELYHPDDIEKIYSRITEETSYNLEYRIIRKDGEIRWLMEYGTYVKNTDTGSMWLDGFIMDITQRYEMVLQLRLAKNKAEQAAKARASFLANMSHEIRTPMNAIIGFSDILLNSNLNDEQQRHLKTIHNSSKSLLHLLNDVLDSAKLDKGKLELEVRDFSLIEEVDTVISTLWLQARNKGLTLNTKISPTLKSRYSGSPERIRQVLTNLINNAIKFTPEGHVTLNVNLVENSRNERDNIEFLIEDSGIGMSQEQLDTVFEPFTQADASMSRRFGGTGLGTTISKQLVELMGGTISAESDLEKGSKFRFILSLDAANIEDIKQQQFIQLPPLTLLIVDDIQQNIDLLSALLIRDGHTVLTARDGQQALIRMASSQPIDLVLMDIQMPVMDGLTAASERRRLEQDKQYPHIPIIALTASVLEEDQIAAEQSGMDGFANKPIDFQNLSHEIARVLNIDVLETHGSRIENTSDSLIDDTKGIELWGSKERYYQQLNYFVDEQEVEFEKLRPQADLRNWKLLKETIHKLKGISGNLSLTRLMKKLNTLESDINLVSKSEISIHTTFEGIAVNESNIEMYQEKISAIQNQFIQVKNNVKNRNNYSEAKSDEIIADLINKNEEDFTETISILQLLKSEANENQINEESLSKLLTMANNQYNIEINEIYKALNDFDFTQAEQFIDALLLQINSTNT